ncbi:MAG: adenine phosphoribosyltransferase, partial [Betaproteobacteria bacterium]|nr:adenine phosphoribosyltransferase [Betaproteobacteria bacterium]
MDLTQHIRTIPDHPKPGILFRDVTTLMGHPDAFRHAVHAIASKAAAHNCSKVAGIEARGFIFGGAVATALGVGFVPLRKPGKLPYQTRSVTYALEYGTDTLHMHIDAVIPGDRVLIVDDLIATGGTAIAGVDLLRSSGASIAGASFVVDLPDLGGANRLRDLDLSVHVLCSF